MAARLTEALESASEDVHTGVRISARREAWSGTGGQVGGEDAVGMSVEVLAGTVLAHGGPWTGVAGSDLHIALANSGIDQ